jgi:hypothetical protein
LRSPDAYEPDDASEFAADDTQASTSTASLPSDDARTSPGEVEESRDHYDEDEDDGSEMFEEDALRRAPPAEPAIAQPEWNEPEGYAPVTNPEADAQAKAFDYYSPENVEKRNRFNPFAVFKREPEGV